MARKLHLALVWHMHQPYYKDDLTGTYLLPWVRLRSAKDYYKMAALLDGYPRIRQTFNLVPSLLEQIDDYSGGSYQDLFLNISSRPAAELSAEERQFLLTWMRESPRFYRVQASPRYLELAGRDSHALFTVEDLRDLQVWFNLAWCDPAWVESDPRLAALKVKDRGFTEHDKQVLFDVQLEQVARVIPKYRQLAERGQVELTFSPYYHPILPLLIDAASAREASPGLALPARPFAHGEDAATQIEMGLEAFQDLLGVRPAGMWPPEMAVSPSIVPPVADAGVQWIISDEGVLGRSLDTSFGRDGDGRLDRPGLLYQPWSAEVEGRQVAVIFRDALLSNLIGFDYHKLPPLDAAKDFSARLRRIREQQGEEDFLVTVALDGENAWDFYLRDGHEFLNALYGELEADEDIVCTTVSDFLREHPRRQPLPRLHTGSWIGASLDTWIGDPEHTVAWEELAEARDWVAEAFHEIPDSDAATAAWREIRITEGSDWYWWFSHRHDSGMDSFWDNEFRLHLRNAYKVGGVKPPARLFQPIIERTGTGQEFQAEAPITPAGPQDAAWAKAGRYEVGSGFGALHKPVGVVERVLFGADARALHIRVDSPLSAEEMAGTGTNFWLYCSGTPLPAAGGDSVELPDKPGALADLGFDPGFVVKVSAGPDVPSLTVLAVQEGLRAGSPRLHQELASPFFFSVPLEAIERGSGEPLEFALVVERHGREVEQVPPVGALGLRLPLDHSLAEAQGGPPIKVLMALAELAPFAKTGGLAEVGAALAKQLKLQGHDVRLVLPLYRGVPREGLTTVVESLSVPLGAQALDCSIQSGNLPGTEVIVYFVDCPQLYNRDAIYGFGDDDARFVYLCRAVLEMLRPVGFVPDVIHVHDWHTALIPNLLDRLYVDDPELSRIATVLTIHNLAFQGVFGSGMLHLAQLDRWGLLRTGVPHLDDIVNVLGRGLHYADVVNTVSERYAAEIQTPEFGEGMEELIHAYGHKLYGILNGIDTELFDPASDSLIAAHYTAGDLLGKRENRARVRAELGLPDSDAPLVCMVSRLYDPKGLDLLQEALPHLLGLDLQLAVMGAGERVYEEMLHRATREHPERVSVTVGFDNGLAHRLYAGSDLLLMPSRTEPGGLAQLIGLRYGTIPVVRAIGGLADSVTDFDPATSTGTGFAFGPYDAWSFFSAVVRAVENHRHVAAWRGLVQRAMAQDVSWERSARRYAQLYRTAVALHGERHEMVPLEAGAR
ncbi:MAG TPA: glycogen/starch synthase [Candidatus Dormibacteraeota bacterium]